MKQIRLSETALEKVISNFMEIVNSIKDEERKLAILGLMDKIGERFFEAPASNKLDYHNCFIGGLAEHSLRVFAMMRKITTSMGVGADDDSIAITALFHDLGKLGSIDENYYIPQENDWRRDNLGEYYTHNTSMIFMDAAQRSLRILTQCGVDLTDEEWQSILIHDGQYIDANKRYAHKECKLAVALHTADMLACKMEKEKWEKAQ